MAKFKVEYKDGGLSKQIEAEDFISARDVLVQELNKANDTLGYSGGIMGPYNDDASRTVMIFSPAFKIVALAKMV